MIKPHHTQKMLAGRWQMSVRTLERWRHRDLGPKYMTLGGRICYRIEDIEAYERASLNDEMKLAPPRLGPRRVK
ncbi:MAG: Helix-turn-helix domain protein [Devosia sp.]|nr:Helix-turn-helix domain protein [Devosia sp.]